MAYGFQITDINFRQEGLKLPAGKYTYSLEVVPTGTSLTFGYKLNGSQTIVQKTIADLNAGTRQFAMFTFEVEGELSVFYPAMQAGAKIFKICLNKGAVPIEASANPTDADEYSQARLSVESDRIMLEVSKRTEESVVQSMIGLESDRIKLEVKNELQTTGIYIEESEIKVQADKFSVLKPDGTPLAIFDENINIDNNGNMTLNSLRVPFREVAPDWVFVGSVRNHVIDWSLGSNVIVAGVVASRNAPLMLPGGIENNGRQITIVWDPYWRRQIAPTNMMVDLTPVGAGKFYLERFNENTKIRLYGECRHVLTLQGVWNVNTGALDWAVLDFVDFSAKPTVIKAGDLIVSGEIDTGGTGNIYVNNYRGSWTFTRETGNKYKITPNVIARWNDSYVEDYWSPNIYGDGILTVNNSYIVKVNRLYGAVGFECFLIGNSTAQAAYSSFEIRATKDINQRHY